MDTYEAEAYLRGLERRKRAGWEQARYIAFNCLRPWVKNLTIDDMPAFSWEKERIDPEDEERKLQALGTRVDEYRQVLIEKYGRHNNQTTAE